MLRFMKVALLMWACITLAGMVHWHRARTRLKTGLRPQSTDGHNASQRAFIEAGVGQHTDRAELLERLERLEKTLYVPGTGNSATGGHVSDDLLARLARLEKSVKPTQAESLTGTRSQQQHIPGAAQQSADSSIRYAQPAEPQPIGQPPQGGAGPPPMGQQQQQQQQPALRYNRPLHTGLGDRLSVFLTVAAAARSVGRDVYMYWHSNRGMNYMHHAALSLEEVEQAVVFPRNLKVLTKQEFDLRTSNLSEIEWSTTNDPKILPGIQKSLWGLDSAYTTAWRTFKLPDGIPPLDREAFTEAYREVSQLSRTSLSCAVAVTSAELSDR